MGNSELSPHEAKLQIHSEQDHHRELHLLAVAACTMSPSMYSWSLNLAHVHNYISEEPGMMAHPYNSEIREVQAGGSGVQSLLGHTGNLRLV